MFWKGAGAFLSQGTCRDNLNYSITKIGQYTKKSPGDLRGLAVTQTAVEDHMLTLAWKTYRVTQKTEPINFFITSTKIKQNNSNFVHSNLSVNNYAQKFLEVTSWYNG